MLRYSSVNGKLRIATVAKSPAPLETTRSSAGKIASSISFIKDLETTNSSVADNLQQFFGVLGGNPADFAVKLD